MTALQVPWDDRPAPAETPPRPPAPAKKRGRRPARPAAAQAWLYHHLTVSGPAAGTARFAAAACGPGVIAWQLDGAAIEEDLFNLAASQPRPRRSLSIEGCRILARQFRERVEARQDRAAALAATSRACPFDLHALLPIPAEVLALGPASPAALAWLRENWGVADPLRQVTGREAGGAAGAGSAVLGYGFFTRGDSPAIAIGRLGALWPALRFVLLPRPSG